MTTAQNLTAHSMDSAGNAGNSHRRIKPWRNRLAEDRVWIVVAGAIVFLHVWIGLIGSSFWLDETGTWWIVKDGPAEAIQRAFSWSGQSPLYYLIAWLSSRIFGLNEIALRLPSVLAMAGVMFFLYRIAYRLLDSAAGMMASFMFLCEASYFAIDARPYALAFLFLTASIFFLLRWVDAGRISDAIAYVLMSALLIYTHPVLAVSLAAGVLYGVVALRREWFRVVTLAGMQLLALLLCAPLFGELRRFYATRAVHTFARAPSWGSLIPALIPCWPVGALILVVWFGMRFSGEATLAERFGVDARILLGAWCLLAPLSFFLLAEYSDLRLFVARYYSAILPGQALCAGALLSGIRPGPVRKALICATAFWAIVSAGSTSHGNEKWREAMKFLRGEAGTAPVLLVSGFIEASDFARLRDPNIRDVLFAPELMYGEPLRSVHLPALFSGASSPEMKQIGQELRGEPRFFLASGVSEHSYEEWLSQAMIALHRRCKVETSGNRFGTLRITQFSCV